MDKSSTLDVHIQQAKADVDAYLVEQIQRLPALPSQLSDAMEYALLGGGKRMRPLLCRLIADAIHVPQSQATVISAAIECIHAYSLIHDDLPAMDDDDTRRGRPTCHIVYGEATAILAGDALQSLAFKLLSESSYLAVTPDVQLRLINTLATQAGYHGMCGGQAIDLAATGLEHSVPHTIETLNQLHRLKTGALLRACVSMPLALSADIPEEHKAQFDKFADAIGLAFQVQDDILDEVGSVEQIGKPQGSDAAQHKLTFPALLGLEQAKATLENLYTQALQALDTLPYNTQSLAAFCELLIQRDH